MSGLVSINLHFLKMNWLNCLKTISDFINNIANDYKAKYTDDGSFLSYFFDERLVEAVRTLDFDGRRIIDNGTGTGINMI